MWKLYKALRKLWLFATCNHFNFCRALEFSDSTHLTWCLRCGRLLEFSDKGTRRHNPHLNYPTLDYTKSERDELLARYHKD